jgi:rubrerythrin
MKIWRILRSLESLEDTMAQCYDCLRLRYAADHEVAAFFARMRDEELSHRDIVRFEQRVMFRSPENYRDLPDYDQEALERTLRGVEKLIEGAACLSLDEALRRSAAFEHEATEQHYRSAVGQASPALGTLVKRLGSGDEHHAARLWSFASGRGIALEN